MSEKTSPTPVVAGSESKPVTVATNVAVGTGPQSSAANSQPASPLPKSPVLFGGHKGGGKKRADGLVAGSEEAKAVDREKNRVRMAEKRAAEKMAALPPALARPTDSPGNARVPLAGSSPVDAGAVVPVAVGPAVLPTFVAWSQKMLERPVKLLTKIFDRVRVASLMEHVRKLGLSKADEAEAEKRMRYKDEQIADFNAALTNCAVIELNKRQIGGADKAHWLELAMTSAELVNCHLDTVDWLEKKVLERAQAEKQAVQPVNN